MNFYLTGTRNGLSAREAKELAAENMPAVARPQNRADWTVVFLSMKPVQPGQRPFELNSDEDLSPGTLIAAYFKRMEENSFGGRYNDEFINPMTGREQENQIPIPISLLRALVAHHER